MPRSKGEIRFLALRVLLGLNDARVRHDRAAVEEFTQMLAAVDARAGYTPQRDPTQPLQHGQRMRAGRSRSWWLEYVRRNSTGQFQKETP